jgi:pantoate--beta-alanine ligase
MLLQIKTEIISGNNKFRIMERNAANYLQQNGWSIDYLSIHRQSDLTLAQANDSKLVVLGAAWLGKTRLIDSLEI